MTTQTKIFIELSDIIGLRLTCRKCGCALLLETAKENGTVNNLLAGSNMVLSKCPTCKEDWAENPNHQAPYDSEIKEFFRTMRDLKKIESRFGCAVSLEISPGEDES